VQECKESADHRVTTDVVKLLWDVTKEQQIQNPTRVFHTHFFMLIQLYVFVRKVACKRSEDETRLRASVFKVVQHQSLHQQCLQTKM
jgi:hypothetical protein